MGESAGRYLGNQNFDVTVLVLCFVCPFLQTLDLSHQFIKVFGLLFFFFVLFLTSGQVVLDYAVSSPQQYHIAHLLQPT